MRNLPKLGANASMTLTVSDALIDAFAQASGDDNPIHLDDDAAMALGFPRRVAHGMSYAAFVSTLIGKYLPGPGALWTAQTFRFLHAVHPGDQLTLCATVIERSGARRALRLHIEARRSDGVVVMDGESDMLVPGALQESNPAPPPSPSAQPVALVAGGGGALGRAISAKLAARGFIVALAGRDKARVQNAADDIPNAIAVTLDLHDEANTRAAVEAVKQQTDTPSVVVHCASEALPNTDIHDTTWDTFRLHHEVQVGGLHRLVAACTPAMRARKRGHFILIGSTAAHGAPPRGMSAYAAAKAGAAALVRAAALEYAPYGVRANVVSPHFLATDLTAKASAKTRKLIAAQTPMRRLAELSEIAGAVGFLASDEGNYVNGHDLHVDGGTHMS